MSRTAEPETAVVATTPLPVEELSDEEVERRVRELDEYLAAEEAAEEERKRDEHYAKYYSETPLTIPPTSRERYLGGMAALNLLSDEDTGEGWRNDRDIFHKYPQYRANCFISGEGRELNTNHILGDEGIFDCSGLLRDMGVPFEGVAAYAATHARAIADFILESLLNDGEPWVDLDEWMPTDADKQKVYDLLDKALPHLTAEQRELVQEWRDDQWMDDNDEEEAFQQEQRVGL